MAFKNAGKVITVAGETLYTCPALNEAVVHALFMSNVDGANSVNVTIEVYDDSAALTFIVGKDIPVPAQSTLVWDKPINLEASDYLKITASVTGDLQAFASILQQVA